MYKALLFPLLLIATGSAVNLNLIQQSQLQFFQSCQFRIMSNSQNEIVEKCNDKTAVNAEYVECSTPILNTASDEIRAKCCKNCLQCSGCENDQLGSSNDYEAHSPGNVPNAGVEMLTSH